MGSTEKWSSNRGLGINVKNCLYEEVNVPMVLYLEEAWGMEVLREGKLIFLREVFEKYCWSVSNG